MQCTAMSANNERFQPPKLWIAIGTGMGTRHTQARESPSRHIIAGCGVGYLAHLPLARLRLRGARW
jgi:hypothetical protein